VFNQLWMRLFESGSSPSPPAHYFCCFFSGAESLAVCDGFPLHDKPAVLWLAKTKHPVGLVGRCR
jgi:hypothetical protein